MPPTLRRGNVVEVTIYDDAYVPVFTAHVHTPEVAAEYIVDVDNSKLLKLNFTHFNGLAVTYNI